MSSYSGLGGVPAWKSPSSHCALHQFSPLQKASSVPPPPHTHSPASSSLFASPNACSGAVPVCLRCRQGLPRPSRCFRGWRGQACTDRRCRCETRRRSQSSSRRPRCCQRRRPQASSSSVLERGTTEAGSPSRNRRRRSVQSLGHVRWRWGWGWGEAGRPGNSSRACRRQAVGRDPGWYVGLFHTLVSNRLEVF